MKVARNLTASELRRYRFMRAELAREIRNMRKETVPGPTRNQSIRWHTYRAFGFRLKK